MRLIYNLRKWDTIDEQLKIDMNCLKKDSTDHKSTKKQTIKALKRTVDYSEIEKQIRTQKTIRRANYDICEREETTDEAKDY